MLRMTCWVAVVSIAGCAASPPADPLEVLSDRDREPEQRIAAADALSADRTGESRAQLHRALHRIAWSDAEPIELRRAAMERLLAADPRAFWAAADRAIVEVDQWPAMRSLFGLAVERRHRPFTRTAIRSYARPSQRYADADREERAVIASLNGGRAVEDVAFEVFEGRGEGVEAVHQVAAWTLLHRLLPADELRRRLRQADPATPVVADLRAAAEWFDELPSTPEQVVWLQRLRVEGRWEALTQKQAWTLTPDQRVGLALRHVSFLLAYGNRSGFADVWAGKAGLAEALASAQRVDRTTFGPRDRAVSQRLEDHADRVAWGDVMVMRLLRRMMDQPDVTASLFEQADADLADRRSEHGGVIHHADRRFEARAFEPYLRRHDHAYYASPRCIEALQMTGLAHYHFHAQSHDNAAYAGPGGGDLAFTDRFGAACVVFTFIDRNTLNVDYYGPGGVVVDLGCIYR